MSTTRLVILGACIVHGALGQDTKTQSTFEVASVKRSAPDVSGMFIRPMPGGGLQITGGTLRNLISYAYDVRSFQISGDSEWLGTERYDIDARSATSEAKTPNDPARMSQDRLKILAGLKSLLADRFQLALHSETRDQPVYALVVNKGGLKIQESREPRSLVRKMARGILKGEAVGVAMLALNLSNELGRRVIDRTGLTGRYDFELRWAPSQDTGAPLAGPLQTPQGAPPADLDGPSIFTALQEQLGLRLESGKGPVEVLVIDRAVRPSKN